MYLKSLYLHNFRLYSESYFQFSPHLNVIYGKNAAGKTSLLEAIYFLASGSSFRTHQLGHLIRAGASYFYLEACFDKHGIEHRLKITYGAKEKKIFLNNTRYSSTSSLIGLLLSVVFSPGDIEILKGSPQERRRFLDSQLIQVNPLYLYHSNRYHRAMKQRNCLLKAKNLHAIHGWEHEMALSAVYLHQARVQLLQDLQRSAIDAYRDISQEADFLSLGYRASCKFVDLEAITHKQYLEQYEKHRPREIALASSLIGPHKDDLFIGLGDKEARFYASEGQIRSCVAALRLAEWRRLHEISGEKPLMLLDDLTTSLDQSRAARLFEQFHDMGQLFVTGTEVSAVPGQHEALYLPLN